MMIEYEITDLCEKADYKIVNGNTKKLTKYNIAPYFI